MCAVTSADGGSMTAPKSQNGSLLTSARVLSASNAPQPPSLDCIPASQRSPRSMAGLASAAGSATRRRASTTSAGSSVSGELSLSNSNAPPPGAPPGGAPGAGGPAGGERNPAQACQSALHDGVLDVVAEQVQGHQRIDPGRLD